MEAVLAWAAIILARHLDWIYPLLMPGAVAFGYLLLRRRRFASVHGALWSLLTVCYAFYVLCVMAGAWLLAWQFSGGGGPVLPVYDLVPLVAALLAALWLSVVPVGGTRRRSGR